MPKVISNGEVTEWEFGESGSIDDVQVNGTSVVTNGIAEIPVASSNSLGVVKINPLYGVGIINDFLMINGATLNEVKLGGISTKSISPYNQHNAVFYGLAKAAGDTTQSQSSNAVGTYTDEAKTAIKSMLDITEPTSNVVIIEGEWTNPQPSTYTVDYADETMSDEKLIEMIEDSIENHTNTIFVLALDTQVSQDTGESVQKRYFYFHEKTLLDVMGIISYDFFSPITANMNSQIFGVGTKLHLGKMNIPGVGDTMAWMEDDLKFDIQVDSTSVIGMDRIANIDSASTAFNGLAKAAGDTTQAQSSNTVGTYTLEAKTAIQTMLGLNNKLESPSAAGTSGQVLTSNGNGGQSWEDPSDAVTDVQINSTSILDASGVAEIPIANSNTAGVIKVRDGTDGLIMGSDGYISVARASDDIIKKGTDGYRIIPAMNQHKAVFYGLAKAAGDTTQSSSANAVGTYTTEAKAAIQSMLDVPSNDDVVTDVQVDGTSVVTDGVAEIPRASNVVPGVVKVTSSNGIGITNATGELFVACAESSGVKNGANRYKPIVPVTQHESVFYGLTKAAGVDMANSSNAVGTYTPEAKAAIQAMLGISSESLTISGTDPVIVATSNTRYICGEVTSLDFTPSATGICDVIFTSGSTVTVLVLPSTVIMPPWFDYTALETNTVYEINIVDGIYGTVMEWQI